MDQMKAAVRSESAHRPRVLLVEDEVSVAKRLEMLMNEEGYDVDLADTGQGALNKFKLKDFDLMVADLQLADIDCMEMIQRVRDSWPETRVVIITGYPSVSDVVHAFKIGVSEYLRKPFTDDEFKAAVEKALKDRAKDSMKEHIMETENERLIQRQEVIRVLDKAYQNQTFWRELMETGSEALKDYHLPHAAKAAIVSGDLNWLRENIGELTDEQVLLIYKRLEQEAW